MKIDDRMMNYEIHQKVSNPAAGVGETGDKQTAAHKIEGSTASQQGTIVELSPALKEAEQIKQIVAAEPDIRTEKVNGIKAQIEAGTYKIDANEIADKLVNASLEELF